MVCKASPGVSGVVMVRYALNRQERVAMGDRLRAARFVTGLTELETAGAVKASRNSVIAWEHGSLPGEVYRLALAELYGVDERLLFAEYYTKVDQARSLLGLT